MKKAFNILERESNHSHSDITLRQTVDKTLRKYLNQMSGQPVSNLHELVIKEVEEPLLTAVMEHTSNNQSKASIMLGLNRGTLRTKLKQYGLL
jgi:Fis family transcriptional regulator